MYIYQPTTKEAHIHVPLKWRRLYTFKYALHKKPSCGTTRLSAGIPYAFDSRWPSEQSVQVIYENPSSPGKWRTSHIGEWRELRAQILMERLENESQSDRMESRWRCHLLRD